MENEKELPVGWGTDKLGNICNIQTGDKDVNQGTLEGSYPFFTCAQEVYRFASYSFDGEAILMAGNGNFNVKKYNGKFEAYQRTYVLQQFHINYVYLYYFILGRLSDLTKDNRGSTVRYIRIGNLTDYLVLIAPLPEQYRIVAKIEELFSELDQGIESLKAAQQQLKVYRQAVLKWAFEGRLTEEWRKERNNLSSAQDLLEQIKIERKKKGRELGRKIKEVESISEEERSCLPELPSGWQWEKLSALSELVGGITKGRDFKGKHIIKLPYLRVANVQDGYLDLREIKEIELLDDEKEKYLLEVNDILYTEGGDKDKLGRGTIWNGEVKDCVHQNHIFRARVYGHTMMPKYMAYYSQTKTAKNYFYKRAKQTVNLASINMTVLSNLPVPIASNYEQQQIVQEIESRLSVCDKLEETIEQSLIQAEALRQSILKKAFEGKLVPQNPDDEPADKLLARIRAEREIQNPEKKTTKGRTKK